MKADVFTHRTVRPRESETSGMDRAALVRGSSGRVAHERTYMFALFASSFVEVQMFGYPFVRSYPITTDVPVSSLVKVVYVLLASV